LHDLDATVMIPIWNLGAAAIMVGLSALLRWRLGTAVGRGGIGGVPARPE
jgi:hypothetical protein